MTAASRPSAESTSSSIVELLRAVGIFIILALLLLFASVFVPGFATVDTFVNIFQKSVVLGLVAIGQTFAIICGSLDLSVGTTISVIAVISAIVMNNQTENMGLAVAVGLLIGVAIGLVNGLIITRLKINAFIATLGTSLILQGILYSSFNNYAGKVPEAFQTLAYGVIPIFGIAVPLGVYVLLAVAFIAFLILRYTRFGYHLYAVGGSAEVARLSGVHTDRVIITAHILTSVGAALAAIVLIARLRAGGPLVGNGADLDSIAAVVLGGTPLIGGKGGVWGTIAGVLIVSVLATIFNVLNVGAFAQDALRGVVLIVVVAIYSYRRVR